jgi:hypothetical protein
MLEAPPAVAIRNAKDGRGLGPSEYAGGGSASSSFPGGPAFLSRTDLSALLGRSQLGVSEPDEPGEKTEYAGAVAGKGPRSSWALACESETLRKRPQETEEDGGLKVAVSER